MNIFILIFIFILFIIRNNSIKENFMAKKKEFKIKYKTKYLGDTIKKEKDDDNIDNEKNIRITFKPTIPETDIPECPPNLKFFEVYSAPFCSENGKIGKNNKTCSLDPDVNSGQPLCNTVKCPDGYVLSESESKNGICINLKDRTDKCILNVKDKSKYRYCNNRNEYIEDDDLDVYGDNVNIDFRDNYSEIECSNLCTKNPECNLFTVGKDENKGFCYLKRGILDKNNIKQNRKRKTYYKAPLNYNIHSNTDISGHDISYHDGLSVMECSKLCNENNNCNSFVHNKNYKAGQCILKSTKSSSLERDKDSNLFVKRKNYHDNIGNICKNPSKNIKKQINQELLKIDENLSKDQKQIEIKINNKIKIYELNSMKNAKNDLIKMFSSEDGIIIWDNINIMGNKVKLELMSHNYLHISNIQIFGINLNKQINKYNNKENNDKENKSQDEIIDLTLDKKLQINTSSILDENKYPIENCIDNNINTYFSTNIDVNPHIIFEFPKEYFIYKIIIYNRKDFYRVRLIPLKILILNKYDVIEKFAIKENFENPLSISITPPDPPKDNPTFKSIGITNYGLYDKFKKWAKIDNSNQFGYCRWVDTDANSPYFSCATSDISNSEYTINSKPGIDSGYPNTSYMKDETGNGLNDLCRCVGTSPNTKVSCLINKKDRFEGEYTPNKKPSNCIHYTGEQLKNMGTKQEKKPCNEYISYKKSIKNKVDAGFYWNRIEKYYLFKNTKINDTNIILYSMVDKETNQVMIGYPKIVSSYTWPGLSFTEGIDTAMYADNDNVYFFSDNKYVKYDLLNKKQVEGYPKTIKKEWIGMPFNKKITCAMYIGDNIAMIFNGENFIDYDLLKPKTPRVNLDIRKINKKTFPGINFNIFDEIVSFYDNNNIKLYIFKGNKFIEYYLNDRDLLTSSNKPVYTISKEFPNLWNLNIHSNIN